MRKVDVVLNATTQFHAVHRFHHHVCNHKVHVVTLHLQQSLFAVGGCNDVVFFFQAPLFVLQHLHIILYKQQRVGFGLRLLRGCEFGFRRRYVPYSIASQPYGHFLHQGQGKHKHIHIRLIAHAQMTIVQFGQRTSKG